MARRLNGWPEAARRRAVLGVVSVVVLAAHVTLLRELAGRIGGLGATDAMPERIAVAYVRELEVSAPPAAPAAPAAATPAVAPRAVRPPAPAASAARRPKPAPPMETVVPPPLAGAEPEAQADTPAAVAEVPVSDPSTVATGPVPESISAPAPDATAAGQGTPVASAEAAADGPGGVPAAQAASAPAGAPAFEWPGPTRLTYKLVGNARGEVHGDAQVEWVRVGTRYQVHLDVTVGLPIAPLFRRRMTSDGDLTPDGLAPRRYDEDTKVAFRERRRASVLFEPDAVVLPSGQRRERPAGVQDSASQFVQLSYLFTLRPELLREGTTIVLPLALPRHVSPWAYDVIGEETVYTPFGAVQAHHLKPRRIVRPGDLGAEMWIAPGLRYLPVRIVIRQDEDNWLDLVISRRPEIADPLPGRTATEAGSR